MTWGALLVASLATWLRTVVALLIGVLWTVPVGVAIGLSPRRSRRLQPIVQVIASITEKRRTDAIGAKNRYICLLGVDKHTLDRVSSETTARLQSVPAELLS